MRDTLPPVHPREMLLDEFLTLTGLSQCRLTKDIGVTPRCINEILHRKGAVTDAGHGPEMIPSQAS
jgi:plasmid maintenance system antidote protein VapI